MKAETRELLKDNLVRVNEFKQLLREKLGLNGFRRTLVSLYLKSPHKIQYALAKYGVKFVVKKKKDEVREFIRH